MHFIILGILFGIGLMLAPTVLRLAVPVIVFGLIITVILAIIGGIVAVVIALWGTPAGNIALSSVLGVVGAIIFRKPKKTLRKLQDEWWGTTTPTPPAAPEIPKAPLIRKTPLPA